MIAANQQSKQEVPLALALLGLAGFLGLYFYFDHPATVSNLGRILDQYLAMQANFLCVVFFVLSLNVIWLYSVTVGAFGFQKQGSRLAALTGTRSDSSIGSPLGFLIALGAGLLLFLGLVWMAVPSGGTLTMLELSARVRNAVLMGIRINFSMGAFVAVLIMGRQSFWKTVAGLLGKRIPEMPKLRNTIMLGTVNEEDPNRRAAWAGLNQRALNGNALASGSIGTGKTQGMVLNWMDQILGNFSPRPSILAIDPKGTFIPEALKIIAKHGLSEHVLHMRLGSDVTFNPIFSAHPLKGAQFMDTAQMIRAAAINFMGKSFDSPFWELSAFNLIKNCLVLCAAKYRNTSATLTDLYNEMVSAAQDAASASKLLEKFALDSIFDTEEAYNIERAAAYFNEYELLDDKVKTGVLATSTAFLNQFQEYQASQLFCPMPDRATIKSMDDVVDGGKILLFDVASPALARSMGTFVKLHYEQSVLNRLSDKTRNRDRTAFLIIDEYQDVVSTGGGSALGDERFTAKAREANACLLAATQSYSSLKNSVGKDDATNELLQNFRTIIACHSTDMATIKKVQELAGQEERKRMSRSVSENSHHPSRNLMVGGFEANNANISESISTSEHKEYTVTGKEFSRLSAFESYALIYDGFDTYFTKLFLKPYFLAKKNISHKLLLKRLKAALIATVVCLFSAVPSFAFPNACTVVKTSDFQSCLDFSVGVCLCGWPEPHPCANFSYYVPQTFIEVFPNPKSTYFGDLPGAAVQLSTLGAKPVPFGAEDDSDTQSFHAHALAVPLTSTAFSEMPCDGARKDTTCFDAMSEHLGSKWSTGEADSLQPNFLAWSLSPKACLLKGAATSITGEPSLSFGAGMGCSVPLDWLPKFPPSMHSACNGWGVFYPRSGVYNGPSQTAGALMIASRLKSLGSEVFQGTPSSLDEKWQMISPQSSSCFREGQNVGLLETIKNVREIGRVTSGKMTGYLFTVWSKVSCCHELSEVATTVAAIAAMSVVCQGLGSL